MDKSSKLLFQTNSQHQPVVLAPVVLAPVDLAPVMVAAHQVSNFKTT